MAFVLDASVAMAWCFADEATEYTESLLDSPRGTLATVPAIWPLEVANVLLVAERRGRLTQAQIVRFAQLLASLPITVDDAILAGALCPVLALAREQGLSAYDAAYLQLAMREGLALATQDARLRDAATRVGVALVR